MTVIQAKILVPGQTTGEVLKLDTPISLWGGVEIETGQIRDANHPQKGEVISDKVLVMTTGRGSSSSASALAEMARLGTAPKAILLVETDPILVMGALVANDLYAVNLPILQIGPDDLNALDNADIAATGAKVDDGATLTVRKETHD